MRKPKGNQRGKGKILSPQSVRMAQRRYQVLKLRRDGFTLDEIAASLNVSRDTVAEDLKFCMTQMLNETAATTAEERQLQVVRIDQLIKAYTPFAVGYETDKFDAKSQKTIKVQVPPNVSFGQLIIQLETRRAKLLALDIPETKVLEVTGIREYVGVDLDKI